jgi:hypothetical protein
MMKPLPAAATLRVETGGLRRWQVSLAARLPAAGCRAGIGFGPAPPPPAGLAVLEQLEALLFRMPAERPGAAATAAPPPAPGGVVIDLSGHAEGADMHLTADGLPFLAGVLAAVLAGRNPQLSVQAAGRVLASGVVAVEEPRCFSRTLDHAAVRAGDLVMLALLCGEDQPPLPPQQPAGWAPAFAAASLAGRLADRLRQLVQQPAHWQAGWRTAPATPVWQHGILPTDGWRWLPSGPERYFADPFVVEHGGERHLFVEEFPFATRRGILSHAVIGADGRATAPRPVLEEGFHLSYPQVFAHAGKWWLLPEGAAGGRLTLYRADPFPHRWVPHAVLIERGIADATLAPVPGGWALFGTLADDGASTWDAEVVYGAPALEGPWQPWRGHAGAPLPLRIDAGSARPAGAMIRHGEGFIRPVQDCRGGYGRALAFMETTFPHPGEPRQRLLSRVEPPAGWRAGGLHTYNACAGLIVVDRLVSLQQNGADA